MSEARKYFVTVRRNVAEFDPAYKQDVLIVAYDAKDALFQAEKLYAVKYDNRWPDQWAWVENVRPLEVTDDRSPGPTND